MSLVLNWPTAIDLRSAKIGKVFSWDSKASALLRLEPFPLPWLMISYLLALALRPKMLSKGLEAKRESSSTILSWRELPSMTWGLRWFSCAATKEQLIASCVLVPKIALAKISITLRTVKCWPLSTISSCSCRKRVSTNSSRMTARLRKIGQ